MYRRFANNAFGELRNTIDAFSTTLFVDGVYADKFPIPTDDDLVWITVQGFGDNLEIMRLVARDGDQFTVVRGQEGTLAQGFVAGAIVELRLTADTLNQAAYKDQDEQVFGAWTFAQSPQVPLSPTQPNDAVPLDYLEQLLTLKGVAYSALTYLASAGQTSFYLTTPDVYGNTLDLPELTGNAAAIAVHYNGALLVYDPGDASVPDADYTVVLSNNLVQLGSPARAGDRVQIELTVREVELVATFETVKLTDFDLDWSDPDREPGRLPTLGGQIDDVRTAFPLHADDAANDYPLVNVDVTHNVLIWIDGSTLKPGADYTVSGSTITFTKPLLVGSSVWAVCYNPA